MSKDEMTKLEGTTQPVDDEEFDIVEAVERMQKYWETYDCQHNYENYSEQMFLDDALYGIGLSMYESKFRWSAGYERFKTFLGAKLFKEQLERGATGK